MPTPSAAELRDKFLALRASGAPLPRPAARLLTLEGSEVGAPSGPREPARYLEGERQRGFRR